MLQLFNILRTHLQILSFFSKDGKDDGMFSLSTVPKLSYHVESKFSTRVDIYIHQTLVQYITLNHNYSQ